MNNNIEMRDGSFVVSYHLEGKSFQARFKSFRSALGFYSFHTPSDKEIARVLEATR